MRRHARVNHHEVQKWAHALGHGDGAVFKPPAPNTVEEALAMMNMALPRLVVGAANLQTGLRELVAVPSEHGEYLEEAKQEAEHRAEGELLLKGIVIQELYSVVPHMEHLIYQASCLLNALRSPAYGCAKREVPYEGPAVPAM